MDVWIKSGHMWNTLDHMDPLDVVECSPISWTIAYIRKSCHLTKFSCVQALHVTLFTTMYDKLENS
jgi:hypothetical protein